MLWQKIDFSTFYETIMLEAAEVQSAHFPVSLQLLGALVYKIDR